MKINKIDNDTLEVVVEMKMRKTKESLLKEKENAEKKIIEIDEMLSNL